MKYHSTPSSVSKSDRTHLTIFGINYAIDRETGGVLIPLGGRKHRGRFAIVDVEDAMRVTRHRWQAFMPGGGYRVVFYAAGGVQGKKMYMHRFILNLEDPNLHVDHINHNGLDNRRANMRVGTHQQNIFNRRANLLGTSDHKGVSWNERVGRWMAQIKKDGRVRKLEFFEDEAEAAKAYDEWAETLFGDHAFLNFAGKEEVIPDIDEM